MKTFGFSEEQVELIKKTCVPPQAEEAHIELLLYYASKYGLDPLTKEIVLDCRWDSKQNKQKPVIITTRDGYLKAAMKDPRYNGVNGGVVKEGDELEIDPIKGVLKHRFGQNRGKIVGAWAVAKAKERDPIILFADYDEYSKANSSSHTWKSYPSAMIQKVAEINAMKRQFNITGMVGAEEIETTLDIHLDEEPELSITGFTPGETSASNTPKESAGEAVSNAAKGEAAGDMTGEAAGEASDEETGKVPYNVYTVVLIDPNPPGTLVNDMYELQAVIYQEGDNQVEGDGIITLKAPQEYENYLKEGAALKVKGILINNILTATEVAFETGTGEPEASKETQEPVENQQPEPGTIPPKAVVTLTRDPKKTTVRWKEQNLEKYYSTCEFPGFDKAFIIGDALKSFKSGDTLEIVIVDYEVKDKAIKIFVSKAKKVKQKTA